MPMQSSHIVLYALLGGVVVALICAFIQLYQPRDAFRAFVPHYNALVYQQFSRHQKQHRLDFLAYLLCKNFHIMSVFPVKEANDNDVLFTTLVPEQPVQVNIVGLQMLHLQPGDLLAFPVTVTPFFDPPNCAMWRMQWRMYPFQRSYKISKNETDYICRQWMKKKLRLNVWPTSRLTNH